MSDYDEFEKRYAQEIDAKLKDSLDDLDEKMPLQERTMRLEQARAEDEAAGRRKELEKYATPELAGFKDRLSSAKDQEQYRVYSGFSSLDAIVGGFRSGNAYLVAGLEKSGKSSLLMDVLDFQLKAKIKVGYVNTELRDDEFADRMTAVRMDLPTGEVEQNPNFRDKWVADTDGLLFYAGVQNPNDLKKDNILSFERTLDRMKEFVRDGCKVLMLDNLTTYNTLTDGKRLGWEILAACINAVVSFTKEKGIVLFTVIHIKPNVVFGETPGGIRNMIQTSPDKIFDDSVIVTRRPSLNDVYGGGGALSQLSGALLVWRPYQKFSSQYLAEKSAVILDSFRHAPSGGLIPMLFYGEKSRFIERESMSQEELATEGFK